MNNNYPGVFITVEGPDGSGKSTLVAAMTEWLKEQNLPFINTKEPGTPLNPVCQKIRSLVLDPNNDIDEHAEIYLMLADRCQHVAKVIRPALAEGKIVISDRYIDSTYAYQGWGRRFGNREDLEYINYLNEKTTNGLVPDLTFLIMVDPLVGLQRATKSEFGTADRMEKEKIDFHRRLCNGYRDLYEHSNRRFHLIDSTYETIEECKVEMETTLYCFLRAEKGIFNN